MGRYILPVSLLKIMNCYHVSLLNVGATKLSLTNTFGDSVVSSSISAVLQIIYSDEISRMMNHTLVIQDYRPPANTAIITSEALVVIKLLQDTYVVNIRVTNTDFKRMYLSIEDLPTLLLIESKHCGKYTNTITIHNCKFFSNIYFQKMVFGGYKDIFKYNEPKGITLVDIQLALCEDKIFNVMQPGNTLLLFNDSTFLGNHFASNNGIAIVRCLWHKIPSQVISNTAINLMVNHCVFHNNKAPRILYFQTNVVVTDMHLINIINTNFTSNQDPQQSVKKSSIIVSDVTVTLKGPIIFHNNIVDRLINTSLKLNGYVEISENTVEHLVFTSSVFITFVENVRFNITENSVNETVFDSITPNEVIPPCYFQFQHVISNSTMLFPILF